MRRGKNINAACPGGDAKNCIAGILTLALLAFFSFFVFTERDTIAGHATASYISVLAICFLLNSGVFGISPSGLVAVEMSFVLDPWLTPVIAGVGSGAGEVTSYLAGRASNMVADGSERLDELLSSRWRVLAASFIGSLVSGNLSDLIGVAVGRKRGSAAVFLIGATAAKITKMVLLVAVAHGLFGPRLAALFGNG